MRPDSIFKISALYKSFTYLLTYLLTIAKKYKTQTYDNNLTIFSGIQSTLFLYLS